MALIIKGDMPKACAWYDEEGHCIRCFNYGACPYEKIDCFPKRPPRCPIIGEIPDEHGDLCDASSLGLELYEELERIHKIVPAEVILLIKKVFDNAPTVVEATT